MSEENVEALKRSYEAYNRGDFNAALENARDDIRVDLSERVFNPAILQGREEYLRDFGRLEETWEEFRYDPDEFMEVGRDRVLVLGTIRGRGRGSGIGVELFSGHLWTFEKGKAVAMRLYRDREEALTAAGLSE